MTGVQLNLLLLYHSCLNGDQLEKKRFSITAAFVDYRLGPKFGKSGNV